MNLKEKGQYLELFAMNWNFFLVAIKICSSVDSRRSCVSYLFKVDDAKILAQSRDSMFSEVNGDRSCDRMVVHLNGK